MQTRNYVGLNQQIDTAKRKMWINSGKIYKREWENFGIIWIGRKRNRKGNNKSSIGNNSLDGISIL